MSCCAVFLLRLCFNKLLSCIGSVNDALIDTRARLQALYGSVRQRRREWIHACQAVNHAEILLDLSKLLGNVVHLSALGAATRQRDLESLFD